jgi:hypothetical protein
MRTKALMGLRFVEAYPQLAKGVMVGLFALKDSARHDAIERHVKDFFLLLA